MQSLREIHVLPQDIECTIHKYDHSCDCVPFIEMVSFILINQEETYFYHNRLLPHEEKVMQEELQHLRDLVQKKDLELKDVQMRIKEAIEFLEHMKPEVGDKTIVNVALEKLYG